MSPEDCYWVVTEMVSRFPGLLTGESVSGADLTEWVSRAIDQDPLLSLIAKGSEHHGTDKDLAPVKWSCPICASEFVPEVSGAGHKVMKCVVCETVWRAEVGEDFE